MTTFGSTDLWKMESKEGLDALFLFATEGILVVDEQGHIVRINPSAEKLFGYETGELVGKTIETLVPKRFAHRHHADRDKYNGRPHARAMGAGMDLFGLRKDGTEFPVEISLSPYASPKGKFVIAFIIDITLRKQAEEKQRNYSIELEQQVRNRTMILEEAIGELEKTKAFLNESLAKERELNELKSRFVSMASHEFRTPLATIQSSLALVKKYGELNEIEKQDKHILKIKASVNNLTDILTDFLSVSKLEEGRVEHTSETFGLPSFIREVISELKTIVKAGQRITYEHTGNDTVVLDQKLLKNILFNLISNAIKFSGEGKTIDLVSVVEPGDLQISVSDHGIGIPQEDQKHLFERFFRGNNAAHIQGTGLGLNIVAKFVELMNGSINFTSEENKGTTFTMSFPQ